MKSSYTTTKLYSILLTFNKTTTMQPFTPIVIMIHNFLTELFHDDSYPHRVIDHS